MPLPFEIRRYTRKTFPKWWKRCPTTMTYGEWTAKKKDFLAKRRAAQAARRKLIFKARQKASFARWHPEAAPQQKKDL